jgi:hypothetical protein
MNLRSSSRTITLIRSGVDNSSIARNTRTEVSTKEHLYMNNPEAFKQFLKDKHMKFCLHCTEQGEGNLMDSYKLAYILYKEFYELIASEKKVE